MAAIRPSRILSDLSDVSTAPPADGDVLTYSVGGSAWEPASSASFVVTSGSYSDPSWITSLSGSKITGTVAVANGGTGATTAAAARTNLGLVIGTDVLAPSGVGSALTSLNASALASGTVPPARLGSGSPSAANFLRGDGVWAVASTNPAGSSGQLQYNNAGAFAGAAWSSVAASGSLFTATVAATTDKPIVLVPKSATASIATVAVASKVCTVTTSAAHGFKPGRVVAMSGTTTLPTLDDAKRTIRSTPTATTFTVWFNGSDLATTAETGTATSQTTTVPLIEMQDGAGAVALAVRAEPEACESISGISMTTTTPMSGRAAIECFSPASAVLAEVGSTVVPWLSYTNMGGSTLSAARISVRAGYINGTPYDAATIDLSLGTGAGTGGIAFNVGGGINGSTLKTAMQIEGDGTSRFNFPVNVDGRMVIDQPSYADAGTSLMVAMNGGRRGVSIQLSSVYTDYNAFEIQGPGSTTAQMAVTGIGNWWMGKSEGRATTRLIVAPRQASDVGLMVAGIASQTGRLLALGGRSSTTDNVSMGAIDAAWTTATHATRAARVTLSADDYGGAREGIRVEADGSAARIGFLGASAVARPAVTGSRGGNAALASLLTALANLGLITDSSTS